jgi:hypothetical protein
MVVGPLEPGGRPWRRLALPKRRFFLYGISSKILFFEGTWVRQVLNVMAFLVVGTWVHWAGISTETQVPQLYRASSATCKRLVRGYVWYVGALLHQLVNVFGGTWVRSLVIAYNCRTNPLKK